LLLMNVNAFHSTYIHLPAGQKFVGIFGMQQRATVTERPSPLVFSEDSLSRLND